MTTAVLGNRAPWGRDTIRSRTASAVLGLIRRVREALLVAWRRSQAIDRAETEMARMGPHMRRDVGLSVDRAPRDLRSEPGWV